MLLGLRPSENLGPRLTTKFLTPAQVAREAISQGDSVAGGLPVDSLLDRKTFNGQGVPLACWGANARPRGALVPTAQAVQQCENPRDTGFKECYMQEIKS